MMGVFWMRESRTLYGRRTEITCHGTKIGDIVEVLPMVSRKPCTHTTTTQLSSVVGRPVPPRPRSSHSTGDVSSCSKGSLSRGNHIGESLMPYTWFTFERLGVRDWFDKAACPKKYSVQFVSTTGKVSQPFYFFETIKHECATTWQVLRSDFDRMLLDNARAKGVEVRQGVSVRELVTSGGHAIGVQADVKGGGP